MYVYSCETALGQIGNRKPKHVLGGKGTGLSEMLSLGLPVPPAFVISTDVCTYFYQNNNHYPTSLQKEVDTALKAIEESLNHRFGDSANPLLLSVRSGARASMPGMMDTVLNLGLNDETVVGLAQVSGDERFAYDSYRRFIQMYSDVVLHIEHRHFEKILAQHKAVLRVKTDQDLSCDALKNIVEDYKDKVLELTGQAFPQDVSAQLWGAITAVFSSWQNQRAITYRRIHNIPDDWGTAVVIQAMVFGNLGDTSATGVTFTRNPATGAKELFGEYLQNAQGEDVVAGIRTPCPLMKSESSNGQSMEERMPAAFSELVALQEKLESHYKDMQDIEFTVQQGKLWLLQTRNGKRTAAASLKIAVDMVQEGLITKEDAILRFDPDSLEQLLHPTLPVNVDLPLFAKGLPASPGAAVGRIYFNADTAEEKAEAGQNVILVRKETSPEDIHGMHAAKGILTACGGMTSHAAVVARGMGRPCIAGASDIRIDYKNNQMTVGQITLSEGDVITLDGTTGRVLVGETALVPPQLTEEFTQLMTWADEIRNMRVRANADTPTDAKKAREMGAEGIGLCRTEHMFFETDRIVAVREMILAKTKTEREVALNKILPMQRQDFAGIFEVMSGLPVNVRLLDPPLHEFLPASESEIKQFASQSAYSVESIRARLAELHESNPMLGHRGCRLGITFPEIYAMQVRALFEGAALAQKKTYTPVALEIMVPLVGFSGEFKTVKKLIQRVASECESTLHTKFKYQIGTMIELPRAALKAGKIAQEAEFFSFGTNDLTQTTLGLSRDDAGSFVGHYRDQGIMDRDPFVSIDQTGVGELVEMACERARSTRPHMKLGVCGEHGGDPVSINFFEKLGLSYVSCSPYRVPIARLSAAKAAIGFGRITEGLDQKEVA